MKTREKEASNFNKERLVFAMRQWESRHGNYLLQGQEAKGSIQQSGGDITEEDARKIFKFIDYNEARVVSKHQIRLLILYQKYMYSL